MKFARQGANLLRRALSGKANTKRSFLNMTKHAIILAAGLGSRLNAEEGHKILAKVGGVPLIDLHLSNFLALGVETVVVVTGHESEELESQLKRWDVPDGLEIQFAFNPDYKLSNGVSVLAGAEQFHGPFWLVMSDHIFDPRLMPRLRKAAPDFEENVEGMLGIDTKLDSIYDMPDANKIRYKTDGSLDEIGKEIEPFDVVDVGLFWCGGGFIQALKDEQAERGDCSTSDAVRRLDARGEFLFWDVEDCLWQDVDTPGARKHAAGLLEKWKEAQ